MAEYIEREASLALVMPYDPTDEKAAVTISTAKKLIRKVLKDTPTADVAPVVHGEWIPTETPCMSENEDCSVCGYRTVYGSNWSYCPSCGARMDGGADNG